MTVFRCTAKLFKAMKAKPSAEPEPSPETRLGDWTAHVVQFGRTKLVLAMNDQTRHVVVVEAAPFSTLPERFLFAVHRSLVHVGIPPELAAQEIANMEPLHIASASSKSVLSAISQVAWRIELDVREGLQTAAQMTAHLSDHSITTINGKLDFPVDHVRKAFGLSKASRRPLSLSATTLH